MNFFKNGTMILTLVAFTFAPVAQADNKDKLLEQARKDKVEKVEKAKDEARWNQIKTGIGAISTLSLVGLSVLSFKNFDKYGALDRPGSLLISIAAAGAAVAPAIYTVVKFNKGAKEVVQSEEELKQFDEQLKNNDAT